MYNKVPTRAVRLDFSDLASLRKLVIITLCVISPARISLKGTPIFCCIKWGSTRDFNRLHSRHIARLLPQAEFSTKEEKLFAKMIDYQGGLHITYNCKHTELNVDTKPTIYLILVSSSRKKSSCPNVQKAHPYSVGTRRASRTAHLSVIPIANTNIFRVRSVDALENLSKMHIDPIRFTARDNVRVLRL